MSQMRGTLRTPTREDDEPSVARAVLGSLALVGVLVAVLAFCALHARWDVAGLLAIALFAAGMLAVLVASRSGRMRMGMSCLGVLLLAAGVWCVGLSPRAMGLLLSGWHGGERPDAARLLADFSNWGQGMGGLAVLIAILAFSFTIYQLLDQRRRDAEDEAAERERRRLLEQSNIFSMAHAASAVLEQLRRSTPPDGSNVERSMEEINRLDRNVRDSLFEQISRHARASPPDGTGRVVAPRSGSESQGSAATPPSGG